jgi:hypothetical protein
MKTFLAFGDVCFVTQMHHAPTALKLCASVVAGSSRHFVIQRIQCSNYALLGGQQKLIHRSCSPLEKFRASRCGGWQSPFCHVENSMLD